MRIAISGTYGKTYFTDVLAVWEDGKLSTVPAHFADVLKEEGRAAEALGLEAGPIGVGPTSDYLTTADGFSWLMHRVCQVRQVRRNEKPRRTKGTPGRVY